MATPHVPAPRPRPARPAPAPAPSAQAHPDTLAFFGVLYHGQAGWCELSYIDGDPSDRKSPFKQEWHYVAGDYMAVSLRCSALGALYGNVYTSRTLYAKQQRSVDCALPSGVIFTDDLPAGATPAPSMIVQTSTGSRQGYHITTAPLDNATGGDLARRAAAATGGDPSGADLTQIVRVPGCTFNTKRGGRFPVQLVTASGPRYTVEQLAEAWPKLARPALAEVLIDERRVGFWLGNITYLLDQEGLPRRVRNPKARARFARPDEWAGDTSAYRYTIAKSLVMHGFPDDEAAALLLHFCAAGSERKGGAWLVADVQRCLMIVRQNVTPYHGIRPTSLSAKAQARLPQPLPNHEPRRKGRPIACTAARLLAFYRDRADTPTHCMMSRAEVCEALNISAGVLGRLERQLTDQGEMYRQTASNRRSSWVVFGPKPADLSVIKNVENAEEMADDPAIFEDTSSAAESHETAVPVLKEHTPLEAPAQGLPLVEPPAAPAGAPAQPSGAVCSPVAPASPPELQAAPPAPVQTLNPPPPAPQGALQPASTDLPWGINAPAYAILAADPYWLIDQQAAQVRANQGQPQGAPAAQPFTLTYEWQPIPSGACLAGVHYDLDFINGTYQARLKQATRREQQQCSMAA
jgi:hypothetical protein